MCPLRKVRNGLCRGSRSFARGPARTMSFDALCSSLFWPFPSRLLCMQDRTSAGSAGMPSPSLPWTGSMRSRFTRGVKGLGARTSGTIGNPLRSLSKLECRTIYHDIPARTRSRSHEVFRCLSMPFDALHSSLFWLSMFIRMEIKLLSRISVKQALLLKCGIV